MAKEDTCTASPDEMFGVDYSSVCKAHDDQYGNRVKKRKTRAEADKDLREGIFQKFKEQGKPLQGFFVSWGYYLGTRIFGRGFWDE
jgi:hypothetical protein